MEKEEFINIFQGFKNLIFKDEEIEKRAEEKLKICFGCPIRDNYVCSTDKSSDAIRDFNYHNEERIKGNKYKGCGCYIEAKVRSNSQCPLGKF